MQLFQGKEEVMQGDSGLEGANSVEETMANVLTEVTVVAFLKVAVFKVILLISHQ